MFEQQPEALRQKVQQLSTAAMERSDPAGWFEELYAQAQGDPTQVPWVRSGLHPYLQDWLERFCSIGTKPADQREALVIGCGLGDDAEALQALGFHVTAFDISPTAIAWCQQRFPQSEVSYQVADLLNLAPNWHHAFNFVLECRNLQALPLAVRSQAIQSVGQLVAQSGQLLVITRLRDTEAEPQGPPWPLSNRELAQFATEGLPEIHRQEFVLGEAPSVKQIWVEYARAST